MKLTFAGTRGEIEARTPRHRMHSSLLISYRGAKVMIDCGLDWLGRFERLRPNAIVLTHAHPDHAWGLKNGASCPVWATEATWKLIADYPMADKQVVEVGKPFETNGLRFTAFPVEHSIRCPAVGYRVGAGGTEVFYVPDV